MNKNILLILVAVVAVGGWLVLNPLSKDDALSQTAQIPKEKSQSSLSESLVYVPADTLLFSGGLEPVLKKEFNALTQRFFTPEFKEQMDENIKQVEALEKNELDNPSPAVKMLFGLYIEYMKAIQDPKQFFTTLNFSDPIDAAVYMVNTVPVSRTKLSDAEAFIAFIARIESAKGIKAEQKTIKNITYRSYSFDALNSGIKTGSELLIAIENDFAVITVHSRTDTDEQLSRLLGLEKPAESLQNGQYLKALLKKHDLLAFGIGYINHAEIIKRITQVEVTRLGEIIEGFTVAMKKTKAKVCEQNPQNCTENEHVEAAVDSNTKPFKVFQTEACRKDLMTMISDPWPRTVFGYTSIGSGERPSILSTRLVLESNDQEVMNNLKTLRGHIPVHYKGGESDVIFGSAIGFNVDAMTSYNANVLNKFSQQKYECQPLIEMQQKNAMGQKGLAMAMFSGFAAGLQGFSTNIFDLSFGSSSGTQPATMKTIDALITLSAQDPQALIMAAKGMAPPPFSNIQIPADGTAVTLPFPIPLPNGMEPKIAIKGHHIVLYVGKQSEVVVNSLDQSEISANGIFDMAIDYGKYINIFLGFLSQKPNDPSQVKALQALKGINMAVTLSVDFKDTGVVIDADTKLN